MEKACSASDQGTACVSQHEGEKRKGNDYVTTQGANKPGRYQLID
jgi:hypothetical protein